MQLQVYMTAHTPDSPLLKADKLKQSGLTLSIYIRQLGSDVYPYDWQSVRTRKAERNGGCICGGS